MKQSRVKHSLLLNSKQYDNGHGNESSPIDRLCLHAKVLEFIHPMTEKKVRFEAAMPKEFTLLLRN